MKTQTNAKKFRLLLIAVLRELLTSSPSLAHGQPNVVVIMVDNHGWGELGCYGGGVVLKARTLRQDRLANEGMRLLNFNVEPPCTPSRSAFMTGPSLASSYPDRTGEVLNGSLGTSRQHH